MRRWRDQKKALNRAPTRKKVMPATIQPLSLGDRPVEVDDVGEDEDEDVYGGG